MTKNVSGFHTTQYDLNTKKKTKNMKQCVSFHTTQYDLNMALPLILILHLGFPYYIVRFKPSTKISDLLVVLLFPYYIVRFKLNVELQKRGIIKGFHTTQYDLNDGVAYVKFKGILFPYYIVRFKLNSSSACACQLPVSILHSTI